MNTNCLARRLLAAALGLLIVVAAHAAPSVKTYLIDFGAPNHTPYVFQAGDFGLTSPPVVIATPATGDYAGFGYKNATFKLGAAVLTFPSVGAYNLNEDESRMATIIGSFFFSNAGREEVGSPVAFTLTGVTAAEKITVAAIGSVQGGHKAVVSIGDARALIDSNESFTPVVSKLAGKTSYAGSFSTEGGEGEANIGAFLITIESP